LGSKARGNPIFGRTALTPSGEKKRRGIPKKKGCPIVSERTITRRKSREGKGDLAPRLFREKKYLPFAGEAQSEKRTFEKEGGELCICPVVKRKVGPN